MERPKEGIRQEVLDAVFAEWRGREPMPMPMPRDYEAVLTYWDGERMVSKTVTLYDEKGPPAGES